MWQCDLFWGLVLLGSFGGAGAPWINLAGVWVITGMFCSDGDVGYSFLCDSIFKAGQMQGF